MLKISEASNYKSLNNKQDLIILIKEKSEYKTKDLSKFSKAQLFCIYAKVDYKFVKGQKKSISSFGN